MATLAAQSRGPVSNATLPGRRYDNRFFSAVAILVLLAVFIGFAPTYYFAGVVEAPLPSPIIHVHGAVFSIWVLLLIVQTSLVSGRRVDVHRQLGVFGFVWAGLMILAGLAAATNALVNGRTPRPGLDSKAFFAVPFFDIVMFGVLIFFAMRQRRNPAAHKRLILLATVALLTAAFARFHAGFLHGNVVNAILAADVFVVLLCLYDLWSMRKVHRVTWLGGLFLIVLQFGRLPLSQTSLWLNFTTWLQTHATWLK